MEYTPIGLADIIEKLENTYIQRQELLTLADALYDKLNPFREDFPPCAEAILTALEDNLDDLDDWAYKPAKLLEGLGHW